MEDNDDKQEKNPDINILQLARWLSLATSGQKIFLIKPGDLRMLYLLFIWEYISTFSGEDYKSTDNVIVPDKDSQISLSEKKPTRLVQLFFHQKYYPLFSRIFTM